MKRLDCAQLFWLSQEVLEKSDAQAVRSEQKKAVVLEFFDGQELEQALKSHLLTLRQKNEVIIRLQAWYAGGSDEGGWVERGRKKENRNIMK